MYSNASMEYPMFNFTNETEIVLVPTSLKMAYCSLITFLLVIGIPGNVLVVYVVGRYAAMQTTTNLYLMSLSIADLLHLAQIIFVISVIFMERFVFGLWLCKLHLTLEATNSLAVTFLLTATSVDRYLAVCHPLKSQSFRSPKVARIIIVLIWIVCLLLLSPLFMSAQLTTATIDNETISQCQIIFSDRKKFIFTQYTFVLGFALPVCAICIFYFLVISRLRNLNRVNMSRSKDRRDSVQRIIRMILALILIYITLWIPYWVHQWILHFHELNFSANLYIALITQFLVYLNSSINPILYAFLSQNFRIMFVQILNCQRSRHFLDTFAETSAIKRGRSVGSQGKLRASFVNRLPIKYDDAAVAINDGNNEQCQRKKSIVYLETNFD